MKVWHLFMVLVFAGVYVEGHHVEELRSVKENIASYNPRPHNRWGVV